MNWVMRYAMRSMSSKQSSMPINYATRAGSFAGNRSRLHSPETRHEMPRIRERTWGHRPATFVARASRGMLPVGPRGGRPSSEPILTLPRLRISDQTYGTPWRMDSPIADLAASLSRSWRTRARSPERGVFRSRLGAGFGRPAVQNAFAAYRDVDPARLQTASTRAHNPAGCSAGQVPRTDTDALDRVLDVLCLGKATIVNGVVAYSDQFGDPPRVSGNVSVRERAT